MMQGLTASHFATDFYPVQPGDVALVHAAAGGVGLLLTQIIKLRGGHVIGRVSSADKIAVAGEVGADHVIVDTEGRFAEEVVRLSGGEGVHVVYDGSGPKTFQASLDSLRRSGTFCWYGPVLGGPGPLDIMSLPKSIKIGYARFFDHIYTPALLRARTSLLFDWIVKGNLKMRIGGVYPLAEAARAMPTWKAAPRRASFCSSPEPSGLAIRCSRGPKRRSFEITPPVGAPTFARNVSSWLTSNQRVIGRQARLYGLDRVDVGMIGELEDGDQPVPQVLRARRQGRPCGRKRKREILRRHCTSIPTRKLKPEVHRFKILHCHATAKRDPSCAQALTSTTAVQLRGGNVL
nr:zinc-binding dehydrogenase [Mesorhizobium sp.]